MAQFRSKTTDPRKENSEEESDEERLGPGSYKWTLKFLSDGNKSNPTRFELFSARKRFESYFIKTRKLHKLNLKSERLGKMLSALEDCVDKFAEIKNEENSEQLNMENLRKSKRMTRSVSSKFERLDVEMNEIGNGVAKKMSEFKVVMKLKNLSEEIVSNFVGDLNCINDHISAYRELRNQLLQYLER